MKRLRVLILLAAITATTRAEDIRTTQGIENKDTTTSRVEPDGLVVSYSAGIVKIPFAELPKELQEKYHYDPIAGAQVRQQLADAKVQREQAIATVK